MGVDKKSMKTTLRITSASVAAALLLSGFITSTAQASESSPSFPAGSFADYVGTGPAIDDANTASPPAFLKSRSTMETPPTFVPPAVTPTQSPLSARQKDAVPAVMLSPGESANPTAAPPGKEIAGASKALAVAATDGYDHFYCSYYFGAKSAWPGPPASGQSWAAARNADVWGAFGYEIATSGRNGFDFATTTQQANLDYRLNLNLGLAFPAGSRVAGWIQPEMKGGFALNSGISPYLTPSSARGTFSAAAGWIIGVQEFKQPLWDLTQSVAGEPKIYNTYYTPGSDWFRFETQIQPGTTNTFNVSSDVKSEATAVVGAGSYAQVDFGSGGIDAPSMENGGHFSPDYKGYTMIEYLVPQGWTVGCQ